MEIFRTLKQILEILFEDTFLDAQASLLSDKQPESSVKETHLRYFWQKMNFNPDICPPCEFEVLGYGGAHLVHILVAGVCWNPAVERWCWVFHQLWK